MKKKSSLEVYAPKALHLLSNRWNSAITEYCMSLIRSLQMQGFENMICPRKGTPAERRANGLGIRKEPFRKFDINEVFILKGIIERFSPEIVFCYGGKETALMQVLRAAKILDNKVSIVRFRGEDIQEKMATLVNLKYRLSHLYVDLVITPSHQLESKHQAHCPKVPVKTIMLGLDNAKFHFCQRLTNSSRPQIVLLGRLDPVKGHDKALKIFSRVLEFWPKSQPLRPQLHIIGEKANLALQNLLELLKIHNLKLDEDVLITTSRVQNIEDVMSQASVGLVSSLNSEIICRVAQEFLLCGCPVYVSGVGSLEEVLIDRSFGFSYRKFNTLDAVANGLMNLTLHSLSESHEEKALRSAKAASYFSFKSMGLSICEVLERRQLMQPAPRL